MCILDLCGVGQLVVDTNGSCWSCVHGGFGGVSFQSCL
jgi:hypothetical protein